MNWKAECNHTSVAAKNAIVRNAGFTWHFCRRSDGLCLSFHNIIACLTIMAHVPKSLSDKFVILVPVDKNHCSTPCSLRTT